MNSHRQLSFGLVRLGSHPTARNKASATVSLASGSVVASIPSLSTCLLHPEKGFRCDGCHILASAEIKLRKCSGCSSYWYCGSECQTRQWKAHHRRICKSYNLYVTSPEYQALSHQDQVDAVLLSQLLAEILVYNDYNLPNDDSGPFSVFMELVKGPDHNLETPPVCGFSAAGGPSVAKDMYARFGNNNFILHSHLNSYAHGIFPLASRSFNHSCIPNAVVKYIITPSQPVRMEVVTLRDIAEGEEITIPYLDPALPFEIRRHALQFNYGFICTCLLCAFNETHNPVFPPGWGSDELAALESMLRVFIFGSEDKIDGIPPQPPRFAAMPKELLPLLHESYLPGVSESFSKTSHDGAYDEALAVGQTLLALYVLIYPVNYPQVGMHALELAKVAWNAMISGIDRAEGPLTTASEFEKLEQVARAYLTAASSILENFGKEGDKSGPCEEIHALQELLHAQSIRRNCDLCLVGLP